MAVKKRRTKKRTTSNSRSSNKTVSKKRQADWKKGKEAASGIDFYRPKNEWNFIKLAEPYYARAYEHWIERDDGTKVKLNCVATADQREIATQKCPICRAEQEGAIDVNTNHRYYFNVLIGEIKTMRTKNGKAKKVVVFKGKPQVMQVGPTVGGAICTYGEELNEDPAGEWDEAGVKDITELVFKINKTGKGLNTRYVVSHLNNPTVKILSEYDVLPDLDKFTKPAPMSEVEKHVDMDDEADDVDDEELDELEDEIEDLDEDEDEDVDDDLDEEDEEWDDDLEEELE